MPVENGEDRAVFLNPDEFGVEATYALTAGGSAILAGIFDNPAELGLDKPGIVSRQPRFVCREADLPAGGAVGDGLAVAGGTYAIRSRLPDGTGMVELHLEKVG